MGWRRTFRKITRPVERAFREVAHGAERVVREVGHNVENVGKLALTPVVALSNLAGGGNAQKRQQEAMEEQQRQEQAERQRIENDRKAQAELEAKMANDRNGIERVTDNSQMKSNTMGQGGGSVAPIVTAIKIARENALNSKQNNSVEDDDEDIRRKLANIQK